MFDVGSRPEIEALTAKFARAITNGDYSILGPYYEAGARNLPPGGPMIEGPEAILAAQQKMVERGITALDLQAVDVIEAGDFVVEIGRVTSQDRTFRSPWFHPLVDQETPANQAWQVSRRLASAERWNTQNYG